VYRSNVTSEAVQRVLEEEGGGYHAFRVRLEGTVNPVLYFGPHLGGHISVGGEMSNFFSSPGGCRYLFLFRQSLKISSRSYFFPTPRKRRSNLANLATTIPH